MKNAGVIADDKGPPASGVAGRIYYQAVAPRLQLGLPPRPSDRVRFLNRGGQLLLLGVKS